MLKIRKNTRPDIDTRFIVRVPVLVILMAIFAISASAAIGYFSYQKSFSYSQHVHQEIYLTEARLITSEARHYINKPQAEIIRHIIDYYNSIRKRHADEYLCVVDNNATLLIHTAHHEIVGRNAGENLLLDSDGRTLCSLHDLTTAEKDFVGNYISSSGEKQIAAFAYSKELDWTFGVHRKKKELLKEVQTSFMPIMKGFLFILLGLLPVSFAILFITFYIASQKRNKIEKHLQDMLHEKEIMLKEIHHRVKNNLQVIVSLISLQGDQQESEKENILFKTIEQRINSMKIVHESLYQSDDYTSMSFKKLIESLIHESIIAWSGKSQNIEIKTEISDLQISLNQAIPCALILNELIVNSLNHAFNDRQNGTIFISAHEGSTPGECIITFKDDGPGFNTADLPEKGMGLIIVDALIKQLKGTIESDTSKECLYRLTFMIEQK